MATFSATVGNMTVRSQFAHHYMGILVRRNGADADPDGVVAAAYALSDAFLTAARADWRAERAAKGAREDMPDAVENNGDEKE